MITDYESARRSRARPTSGNICWDCQRAGGWCPWSGRDPVTGEILYQPVPGWTAELVPFYTGKGKTGYETTFHITACPLYEPDPPRPPSYGETELSELMEILRKGE